AQLASRRSVASGLRAAPPPDAASANAKKESAVSTAAGLRRIMSDPDGLVCHEDTPRTWRSPILLPFSVFAPPPSDAFRTLNSVLTRLCPGFNTALLGWPCKRTIHRQERPDKRRAVN